MAKRRHTRFDYRKMIGEIALRWNLLEVAYHGIFWPYLKLEMPIVSAILNSMGSDQKAGFLKLLAEHYEEDNNAKVHLAHLSKMMKIVSENRNIAEHALPPNSIVTPTHTLFVGPYTGTVFKRNRIGKIIPYKATKTDLRHVVSDISRTHRYIFKIVEALHRRVAEEQGPAKLNFKSYRKLFAAIDKPPLPRKLAEGRLGPIPKSE